MVDAPLITAVPSTKNCKGECDPKMRSVKKRQTALLRHEDAYKGSTPEAATSIWWGLLQQTSIA